MSLLIVHREYDLQFQRDDYMSIPSFDSLRTVWNYVREISFNPARNRPIIAPTFLQLSLDRDFQGIQNEPVRFFLVKADVRKEFKFKFLDQEILYAEIDGGEAWGRRKQVTMQLNESTLGNDSEKITVAIEKILSLRL
jgi:hypothetical protein